MRRLFVPVLALTTLACTPRDERWILADARPHQALRTTVPPVAPGAAMDPFATSAEPLRIGLQDAILLALEHNADLRVQRLDPLVQAQGVRQAEALFDPVFSAYASRWSESFTRGEEDGAAYDDGGSLSEVEVRIRQNLWTGTSWSAGLRLHHDDYPSWFQEGSRARAFLSVNQALLQGFGSEVGLVALRQARIGQRVSEYGVRGFAIALVAEVQRSYWAFALARQRLRVVEESLSLAERQLEEAREIVAAGRMAGVELAAAEAELAARRENAINARSQVETARLRLLQIIASAKGAGYDREVALVDDPFVPTEAGVEDVASHVAVAERLRPELNQARLHVQRGDLTLVRTRNGLLPRLDLFLEIGGTAYADSVSGAFAGRDGDGYDLYARLDFALPVGNEFARATHDQAVLHRDQALAALHRLERLVELEVRTAHQEVLRAAEQIKASAATLRHQTEKLEAETEKFRIGSATSLAVAQAQRDLLASRLNRLAAVVDYLNALDALYRADGSLLERRGIRSPGVVPVPVEGGP